MRKIICLSIISLGLIVSCKGKIDKNESVSDSLVVAELPKPVEVEEEIKAQIIYSDFDKVQKLANTKNDTVYITNYWATWCMPCVEEIPDFVDLREEYKDKKVKFIFVNVDEFEDVLSEVIPFVKKYKMQKVYQISLQELEKFQSFNPELTQAIPVTVIQKREEKEGLSGSFPKSVIADKIEGYLSKK
ncbi:MAG: TlpA family protein disulfide reductase [Flavobacteriaceae bacterium]|jgi:thiol-disulfide isomerase/thioredoxin|nr:TlpA family protein disulfide reductase [Flavobacteriaceae bacterium]